MCRFEILGMSLAGPGHGLQTQELSFALQGQPGSQLLEHCPIRRELEVPASVGPVGRAVGGVHACGMYSIQKGVFCVSPVAIW